MTWLAALPWRSIRAGYRAFRRAMFTKPRPEGTYAVVDVPVDEVRSALGRQGWAPNWEQSYNQRGEDLNLASVAYAVTDDRPWQQAHVRGWQQDGRVWLCAHWELEPTEHPEGHLRGDGFDVGRGMDSLEGALHDAGLDFETVMWSR